MTSLALSTVDADADADPTPDGDPAATVRPNGSVRALALKLVYANHRSELGPQRWDRLAASLDVPTNVKGLVLTDTLPLAPFVQLLQRLAADLDEEGGSDAERLGSIGARFAERWAGMHRSLVRELAGRPAQMLEVVAHEVHPWLIEGTEPGTVERTGATAATVQLPPALPDPFLQGLLAGFVATTGTGARVHRVGAGRFELDWEPVTPVRPHGLEVLVQATRARLMTATLVPVVVGGAYAAWQGRLEPLPLGLTVLAAAALHLAANTFNDVIDHARGVDEANLTPTPFSGGSRVIQRGLVGWKAMAVLAAVLALVGAGSGLILMARAGVPVLVLGVLGVALGYAYTGSPFKLAHRGLGELTVAVVFGPLVTAGTVAVQTGSVTGAALAAGIPVGLLMAGFLYASELPDAPWDARTGKRTLVVRLGEHAGTGLAVLLAATFASIPLLVLAGVLPAEALVAVAGLPLAWRVARGAQAGSDRVDELVPVQARALALHGITGLLLTAGLALSTLELIALP